MSNDQDRVAVPTNGRRPHAVTIEPDDTRRPTEAAEDTVAPTTTDLASAVSARSLAIGFGILASLGLLVVGRVLRARSEREAGPGRPAR
jgi:hypothetical protein